MYQGEGINSDGEGEQYHFYCQTVIFDTIFSIPIALQSIVNEIGIESYNLVWAFWGVSCAWHNCCMPESVNKFAVRDKGQTRFVCDLFFM